MSLNCPALLASRAHLGRKPMSWTVKTVALKSGAYWSSKGQLMKTLRSKFAGRLEALGMSGPEGPFAQK